MIILVSLFSIASSISFKSIPATKTPPPQMLGPISVLDNLTNTIYVIGGNQVIEDKVISDVNTFNLENKVWQRLRIDSDYIPAGLANFGGYLRQDRKILTFGYFTEVFIFNLENNAWSSTELQGHQIGNVMTFGYTSFTHNNTEYFGLFGGMKGSSYTDDLVM